jgi:hypothetical protein
MTSRLDIRIPKTNLIQAFSPDSASFYIFLTTKFENIQLFSNNIINDPTPLTIPASPKIIRLGDFIILNNSPECTQQIGVVVGWFLLFIWVF